MMLRALAVCAAMLASVAASWALTPRVDMVAPGEARFADIVPREFGDWREVPSLLAQVDVAVRRDGDDEGSQLYDEVLARTYRNSAGEVVMLSIAYGRRQRQEVKIHRPELCYAAQGFEVAPLQSMTLETTATRTKFAANALIATAPGRIEPVVYWVRVGDTLSTSAVRTRLYILVEGLRGRVVDGVLVRTSQIVPNRDSAADSLATQHAFIESLVRSLTPDAARRLVSS